MLPSADHESFMADKTSTKALVRISEQVRSTLPPFEMMAKFSVTYKGRRTFFDDWTYKKNVMPEVFRYLASRVNELVPVDVKVQDDTVSKGGDTRSEGWN